MSCGEGFTSTTTADEPSGLVARFNAHDCESEAVIIVAMETMVVDVEVTVDESGREVRRHVLA